MKIDLEVITQIACEAGEAIMQVYQDPSVNWELDRKADDSPLTIADMASHRVIQERLQYLTPEIPILSEEGHHNDWSERQHWQRFWLVDPLDGTKEFLKQNDEFTVNIALIEHGASTLGVVHAPALGEAVTVKITVKKRRPKKRQDVARR